MMRWLLRLWQRAWTQHLWKRERLPRPFWRRGLRVLVPLFLLANAASAMPSPGLFDVCDYGAVADGATDDGPAIQAAVIAAIVTGGGVVYLPAGRYRIATPVLLNLGTTYVSLIFRGDGSTATQVLPDTGSTIDTLVLGLSGSNSQSAIVEHMAFVAPHDNYATSRSAIRVEGGPFSGAHLRDLAFYGTWSTEGVVWLGGGSHTVERVGLYATKVWPNAHGAGIGMIHSESSTSIVIRGVRGVDYGQIGSRIVWSACCASWISVYPPARTDWRSGGGHALLEDLVLDEGPYNAVSIGNNAYPRTNADHRGRSAVVRHVAINQSSSTDAAGIFVWNYNTAVISDWFSGWAVNSTDIVQLYGVGSALIQRVYGDDYPSDPSRNGVGPNHLFADSYTGYLRVEDSHLSTVNSAATRTVVVQGGVETWTGACRPEPTWCE